MSQDCHGHNHGPIPSLSRQGHDQVRKRLLLALILTFSFMLAEVVGGILSGSMALLADAGHMLTDAASLMLAWSAVKAADRTADEKRTYGYHRAQVLAAFVNGLALLAIVAWIIYESINRLYEPVPVIGRMMLIVASIGLLVNLLVFYILHRGGDISLNLRSAALHVLGDLLGSVAAIAAGIVIIFTGWSPIDPLLSIFVAMLILRGAWSIVKTAGHILMEGTPDDFDEESLRAAVKEGVPGVTDLHHIHAWVLADQRHLLTMHVQICQGLEHREIIDQINDILKQRFAIDHATIQLEEGPCHDLECPMA